MTGAQRFALETGPPGWVATAPVQVVRSIALAAPVERAFAILADHERWPLWFKGMRRTRVDGPATGVGALRTVWVGPMAVQERFTTWDPQRGVTFDVVSASLPGLGSMTEEWLLTPEGDGSRLDITIAVRPAGPLRFASGLVRPIFASATKGCTGIAQHVTKTELDDFAP